MELIKWDIYEIRSDKSSLNGVMLRGRIRKFYLEKGRNVLAENTSDLENSVRFAVLTGDDISDMENYLKGIVPDCSVELVSEDVANPVLSKLKVNIEERYTL